jgi:hypothetical protein
MHMTDTIIHAGIAYSFYVVPYSLPSINKLDKKIIALQKKICGLPNRIPNVTTQLREKLVRERGAGSGEQGFHLQIVWNFDDHGEADLLPWIINVWTFIKYWR